MACVVYCRLQAVDLNDQSFSPHAELSVKKVIKEVVGEAMRRTPTQHFGRLDPADQTTLASIILVDEHGTEVSDRVEPGHVYMCWERGKLPLPLTHKVLLSWSAQYPVLLPFPNATSADTVSADTIIAATTLLKVGA